MKRITHNRLAFCSTLSMFTALCLAGVASATPAANGVTIQERTFNDCPTSTVTTTNNYPALVEITDAIDAGCVGFANLHSWTFSADGGATSAVFNNPSNFRFGATFKMAGAGTGEGGLRISPWYGQFVDGRFMANSAGEIACFGGAIPFYSFTVNHGISYVKGNTIRLEVSYQAHDLFSTDPATIQYRAIYNGNTYDSPVLPFGQQNPAECNPRGCWGMLNDGRVGSYFQVRANTGASLTASWTNIEYEVLPEVGTPVPDGAFIAERTFNDCPTSTLTSVNNYPATVSITDVMDGGCVGFANLHSWSFSDDAGVTAAPYHDNSNFHYFSDFRLDGAGTGEGGLRLSPWYGKLVDGRFMANATSGEIACFGGALPFYSFTANHGVTYVKGTTIHLDVKYRSNDLIAADPATIQYVLTSNGTTYDSGELLFGEGNVLECDPYYLWGMLNDGRAGGYFQVRANTGASLAATWSNIRSSNCPDPVAATAKFHPHKLNLKSKAKWITVDITPAAPNLASDIDVSSLRLNGEPISTEHAPKLEDHNQKLKVRFSRPDVTATLTPGDAVPMLLSGNIGGGCFEIVEAIKVKAPHMHAPAANAVLAAGAETSVEWTTPDDVVVESVTLLSSFDDGVTWNVEAEGLANTGHYNWLVPNHATAEARLAVVVMVTADETGPVNDAEFAQTDRFTIGSPLAVGSGNLGFALYGATPNPSRGLAVSFSLPSNREATLAVFDVSGREVSSRSVGSLGAGRHTVSLAQAGRLPVGVYMVQLVQGTSKLNTRAIVVE